MRQLERQLATSLKHTNKRIWHGVVKDVSYIRQILNEVHFLKFKVSGVDCEAFSTNLNIKRKRKFSKLYYEIKRRIN